MKSRWFEGSGAVIGIGLVGWLTGTNATPAALFFVGFTLLAAQVATSAFEVYRETRRPTDDR